MRAVCPWQRTRTWVQPVANSQASAAATRCSRSAVIGSP